jgi:glycosyltransferase involved in cell wall biosynthesis
MTNSDLSVSVIIPAFNEELGIRSVLTDLVAALADNRLLAYEVLVVDDGSEDNTAAVAAEFSDVRVIVHQTNQGYGASLKSGIRQAQYEVLAITDADNTYPNAEIPILVQQLVDGSFDMVVGARIGDQVSIPLIRRPAKWIVRQLAIMVAEQPIPDLNSGLRVFRRTTVRRYLGLLPNGFSFTTTITLAMLTNDCLVAYHPINYAPRIGRSKIRPIRDTIGFVGLVLRIALYFAPMKLFMPLGTLLALAGLGWGLISRFWLDRLADVSTLVIVLAGMQVGLLGLVAELINRRLPNIYREN